MNAIAIYNNANGSNAIAATYGIEDYVNNFLRSQDVKESSRQIYKRTLKQFFVWIKERNYSIAKIARPQILEYKENLFADGKSSLTVAAYLVAVRKFYEYAEAEKIYPNVAKNIKSPRRKQQFRKQPLTPAQATQLLDYFKTQSARNYAIINLILRTGLRTIEVTRANIGDITFKGGQRVLLVQGKGRDEKDNFVELTDKTYKPIAEYLKTRKDAADTDPLFISDSNNNGGNKLTTRTISFIAKEGLKAIGLDNKCFTAHSLRHTTAVSILRAGGSLETAQFTLRHSNPATTQIYTATLREEQRLANGGEVLIDNLF